MIRLVANIGTAIAAVVALITFIVATHATSVERQKECARRWQDVEVYKVLVNELPRGMSFEQLKAAYRGDATVSECDLSKNDIKDDALWSVLLRLHSAHALKRDEQGRLCPAR